MNRASQGFLPSLIRRRGHYPLRRSGAQRQANSVEDIDEVAWRARLAHRRDPLQHLHLLGADVMCTPNALVASELLPGRAVAAAVFANGQQIACARIGEEVQFAALQA